MSTALLLIAAIANLAPQSLALLFGGSEAAWGYVCYGVEAAALWMLAFVSMKNPAARFICAWGLFESFERPACRLAFPMDRAPQIGSQNLCDAATGLPMSVLGLVFALFVAALAQEFHRVE